MKILLLFSLFLQVVLIAVSVEFKLDKKNPTARFYMAYCCHQLSVSGIADSYTTGQISNYKVSVYRIGGGNREVRGSDHNLSHVYHDDSEGILAGL